MTRDEILNMPAGREMDALISEKVMGWKFVSDPASDRTGNYWSDPVTHDAWSIGVWQPSQYIQHAFYVIEKIVELSGADFSVANRQSFKGGVSRSYIGKIQYGNFEYDNPDLLLYVVSDTAPLAICRAALLATMEAKDER